MRSVVETYRRCPNWLPLRAIGIFIPYTDNDFHQVLKNALDSCHAGRRIDDHFDILESWINSFFLPYFHDTHVIGLMDNLPCWCYELIVENEAFPVTSPGFAFLRYPLQDTTGAQLGSRLADVWAHGFGVTL